MYKLLAFGLTAAIVFLFSGFFLVANSSESVAAAVKSRECRANLRKFRKKDRFAAFAISRDGLAFFDQKGTQRSP